MWNQSLRQLNDVELLRLGSAHLTLGSVAAATVIMFAFMVAAWVAGVAVQRLRVRTAEGSAALYLVEKVLS